MIFGVVKDITVRLLGNLNAWSYKKIDNTESATRNNFSTQEHIYVKTSIAREKLMVSIPDSSLRSVKITK